MFFSQLFASFLHLRFVGLLLAGLLGLSAPAHAQPGPVAAFNAASFSGPLAPNAIAAAFLNQPAIPRTTAASLPLPTLLGGTSLEINGRAAGLFFVSPEQINFVAPDAPTMGTANLTVRVNGAVVAAATVAVQTAAPGVFTANADGRGVPAAELYRNSPAPTLAFECVAGRTPRCTPRAVDLCAGQVTLALYLTGISRAPDPNRDGNVNESIRVVLGGRELTPVYAGAQGGFAGLDQLNVVLPPDFAQRGLTSLTVTAPGNASSNQVELDFTGAGAIRVGAMDPLNIVAGQPLTINGAGFSLNKEKNIVRLLGAEGQADAQVVNATATQLTVLVPFGAETGRLSVTNLDVQCGAGLSADALAVRTSISGFFKDTSGAKIKGATIRIRDALNVVRNTRTNEEGSFVLPDLAPGLAEVEVDGATAQASVPYPALKFKMRVREARDNQINFPSTLQRLEGATGNLTADGVLSARQLSLPTPALPNAPEGRITLGNVVLDIPDNAVIRFPDGRVVNQLTLSLVGDNLTRTRALTPVILPERHYSSTIIQVAPFGATITPGAKLTLPNSDGFPAGAQAQLFRLDQRSGSPTLGEFIASGTATVSSDGQRLETAANAITETTVYFASLLRPTITVVGNVVEADQIPVRRALLGSRGQSGFTDGNGGFVVRSVPVNALPSSLAEGAEVRLNEAGEAVVGAEVISVEANYLRPTKIVSRKENNNVQPGSGNTTSAGVLVLDQLTPDNPPVITGRSSLNIFVGETTEHPFIITRGGGQSLQVSVTGAAFATIRLDRNDSYLLRLTPTARDVGTYQLVITAVNDLGRVATHALALTVAP